MQPDFFLYTFHILLRNVYDFNDFAGVDLFDFLSSLWLQLRFNHLAILTDSKNIVNEN